MSKFLGFLLGIAVALVGPAMFGVLAADGGIKLNTKEMALAYGIGALIFWTVLSYFSGAAALAAALTFGAMIYTVHWIPNRLTNFLNDVPGVTTGMIDGIKQYTLNGVVPILAVISLFFAIQLIVQSVQRRRRERAEAERRQREQDAAQQQEIESTAMYPVPVAAGAGAYQPDSRFGNNFGNSTYDDLFEEEPTSYPPRSQADEQTAQFANAPVAETDTGRDETVLVPTDRDGTVLVPANDGSSEADEQAAYRPDESADDAEPHNQTADQDADHGDDETVVADDHQDETVVTGADRDETVVASTNQDETVVASTEPAPQEGPVAETDLPQAPPPQTPPPATPQAEAPAPPSPQEEVTEVHPQEKPQQQPPSSGTAPQASSVPPVARAAPPVSTPQASSAAQVHSRGEEMGQQYRERMDGPDVDDTGEFHVSAFENPTLPTEAYPQAPRVMDLPGTFRSAGA